MDIYAPLMCDTSDLTSIRSDSRHLTVERNKFDSTSRVARFVPKQHALKCLKCLETILYKNGIEWSEAIESKYFD